MLDCRVLLSLLISKSAAANGESKLMYSIVVADENGVSQYSPILVDATDE